MADQTPQPDASSGLQARLDANPDDFPALLELARLLLREKRPNEALALIARAATLNPGHAAPFTLKATTLLREQFGAPPPPKPLPAGASLVSMRQLGQNGQFGNQLLQYAFLRLHAERHGLAAQVPDWIGRDLFGLDDPFPDAVFAVLDESGADLFAGLKSGGPAFATRDLAGFFCRHTREWGGSAASFRALYQPAPHIQPILQRAVERLRARAKTLVAIHLRRGDFGYGLFWIAPAAWYHAWLDGIWNRLDAPLLYVASDDPGMVAEFARFGAVTAATLGVTLPGADFYLDHYLLSQADHLAISNSTFSFTAAMLNQRAGTFVRPDPDAKALVAFKPWDASPLLQPDPARQPVTPEEDDIIARRMGPRGVVVHVGSFCSAWTNRLRQRHPQLRVIEIAHNQTLDDLRARQGPKHVNHLVIEEADNTDAALAGSAETIGHARVDAIHFKGDPGAASRQMLERAGYRLFAARGAELQPLADQPGVPRLAIQERLLAGRQQSGLDLEMLCARHGIAVRGVIHVGAHEGRELPVYERLDAARVLFIEANPAVFARLEHAIAGKAHVTAINRAIADRAGTVTLHLTSFDQSSSLLPLARHRAVYPQIVPAGTVNVEAAPLDGLLEELDAPAADFNLLAVDVQGAEALVLKGARQTLARMDAVSIEVNFTDLYRGAAEIEDIDALLAAAGFRRAALISPYHPSWGDAFYVRK